MVTLYTKVLMCLPSLPNVPRQISTHCIWKRNPMYGNVMLTLHFKASVNIFHVNTLNNCERFLMSLCIE